MCSTTAACMKLVSAAGLAPAVPRSQAECVGSLRYALENGGPEGTRTLNLPADNGLLR